MKKNVRATLPYLIFFFFNYLSNGNIQDDALIEKTPSDRGSGCASGRRAGIARHGGVQRATAKKFMRSVVQATKTFIDNHASAGKYVTQTLFKGQIWQMATALGWINPHVLPSPLAVLQRWKRHR
jgi:hypothetical protein